MYLLGHPAIPGLTTPIQMRCRNCQIVRTWLYRHQKTSRQEMAFRGRGAGPPAAETAPITRSQALFSVVAGFRGRARGERFRRAVRACSAEFLRRSGRGIQKRYGYHALVINGYGMSRRSITTTATTVY